MTNARNCADRNKGCLTMFVIIDAILTGAMLTMILLVSRQQSVARVRVSPSRARTAPW